MKYSEMLRQLCGGRVMDGRKQVNCNKNNTLRVQATVLSRNYKALILQGFVI